jgi:aminopeptidase N
MIKAGSGSLLDPMVEYTLISPGRSMRFQELNISRVINIFLWTWLLAIGFLPPGFAQVPEPAPCHSPPPELLAKLASIAPPDHDRGYDVLSYDLDLVLDPEPKTINGRVLIGLQALDQGLQLIHLDFVENLNCLDVSLGGETLSFDHRGDSLLVSLPSPLSSSRAETLSVSWDGRPMPHGSFRAGLLYRRHHAGTIEDFSDDMPIIANISETWSAHSWWPCKDHPADKALVSLAASVPDTLSLVSNGILENVDTPRPGWRKYHWRESYPLPTYLVSVAASNYESWWEDCRITSNSGPDQTIPLGFHVFPHDRPDGEIDLAVTCQALQFMTDLAGPYPFLGEKYDQAEISWYGAMEHPTATSLPAIFFTGTGRYETLLVHECAHHWFGNSLTPAVWSDIWLNEGFARYCEALWLEQTLGRAAYVEFMNSIGSRGHENMFVGDGLLADPDPILPNLLVYDKGAWLLHSLRLLVGDEDFFALLNEYANNPALIHGHSTTDDFIRMAESQAGRNLDHFFDPWLNRETVALLHSTTQVAPNGQTGTVRLIFQQLQETWIEMGIPVDVHCGNEVSRTVLVMRNRAQEFVLPADGPVDSVVIDPEGMVFMQMAEAAAPFLDVVGPWPNPVRDTGSDFRIHLLENSAVSVTMYDARGRRVHQGGLGFLEATGAATEPDTSPHVWHWSPDQVEGLAAGIYWLEFTAGGKRCVRKMAYVH